MKPKKRKARKSVDGVGPEERPQEDGASIEERSDAVNVAADKLMEWIQKDDDLDDKQLKGLQSELTTSWKALETSLSKQQATKKKPQQQQEDYMEWITDAFADELNQLRETEGDNLDVDVLVDCLAAGKDVDLMFADDENEPEKQSKGGLTPHEQRRRQRFGPPPS